MTSPQWPMCVFAEPDYRYGVGPLTLRVEHVDWTTPISVDGQIWYCVTGMEIDRAGVDRQTRQALIRASRLPAPPPNVRRQSPNFDAG
jgi:hypothetical protein